MAAPAEELYISDLFKKASAYTKATYDCWYILSAYYGLVEPRRLIAPYDRTLNRMPVVERRAWAARVLGQLHTLDLPPTVRFYFHAGVRYR